MFSANNIIKIVVYTTGQSWLLFFAFFLISSTTFMLTLKQKKERYYQLVLFQHEYLQGIWHFCEKEAPGTVTADRAVGSPSVPHW